MGILSTLRKLNVTIPLLAVSLFGFARYFDISYFDMICIGYVFTRPPLKKEIKQIKEKQINLQKIQDLPDDIVNYIGNYLHPLTKKQRIERLLKVFKREEWQKNIIDYVNKHPHVFNLTSFHPSHVDRELCHFLIRRRCSVCETHIRNIMNASIKEQIVNGPNYIFDVFGNIFAVKYTDNMWKSINATLVVNDLNEDNSEYLIIIYKDYAWLKHYLER